MQEADRLLTPVAPDKGPGHAPGGGAGLEKGVGHRQVAHRAGPQLAQGALRAGRFALEHADGLPAGQQVARPFIVEGDVVQVKGRIVVPLDQALGLSKHRQGPDAQQVQLGQAKSLHVVVVELGDQKPLGRPLQRYDIRQRPRGDDHAARMHAQVVGLAHDAVRGADHLALARVRQLGQHILYGAPVPPPWIRVPAPGQAGYQPPDLGLI